MKFAVKVHNKFLSKAIQELAFKNGYKWCDGAVCMDIVSQYPDGDGVLFLEDKEITHCNVSYVISNHPDTTLFDAKTDWDKIEQAMKPKEPRVIWVNEYKDGLGGICWEIEGNCKIDGEGNPDYIRTIKFQEVI